MRSSIRLRRALMVLIAGTAIRTTVVQAVEKVVLDGPTIVIDANESSFVQYACQDLADYLKDISGKGVSIIVSSTTNASPMIVVGPKKAAPYFSGPEELDALGDQGYALKSVRKDGADVIIVAGSKPQGTNAAVYDLMRRIQVEGKQVFVTTPLEIRAKPTFRIRGLHFNGWPFSYPHAFRRWSEKDWHNYLDIMAYQGTNLFFFWPFVEIMPLPLSPEDQAYLAECKRIVDYAHEKHGMEVWIMQCTNRVAKDDCGVTDPKARPYWRPSQEDLKTADPKNVERILASREALYRAMDNVDGVCNIDSDPGFCKDCSIEDYVKMLKGFRALLDKHNRHGKQTKLMSWMWMGWGRDFKTMFDMAHQERTLKALEVELPGRWGPVPGNFDYLGLCRKLELLDRSVLLPYGAIEDEPSYPTINVGKKGLREQMNAHFAANLDMPGAIGNVQTPLLQLPNIYYFMGCLRDLDYRKTSEKDLLLELAGHLYPEHRQLVADCYQNLSRKSTDADKMASLANELDDLIQNNKLGRLGIIGRKLFPDHCVVAQALVLQLRLKAEIERLFKGVTPTASSSECAVLLRNCCDAYLAWDVAHGWHDLWGWRSSAMAPLFSDPRHGEAMRRLAKCLKNRPTVDACLADVSKALTTKYDTKIVQQGCIEPLSNSILGMVANPATWAKATASVVPDPARYPPENANDGQRETLYWPGALTTNNEEWLQLSWDIPQEFRSVVVRFLRHPSMYGRTIHLQHETQPSKWVDLATTVIREDDSTSHVVAAFDMPTPVKVPKIRIVNLLDVFEVEVH